MNSEINNKNVGKSANGNLIDLLNELNIETDNPEKMFSTIAEELMYNYQIVSVSDEKFNIHEIEFYFFNKNHQDPSVHRHNMKAGQWRVHYSGLDITFNGCTHFNDTCKNKKCIDCKLCSYGGILIRSIGNSENLIVGPLRVQTNLLSGGNIGDSKGISLKKTSYNKINKLQSTRCGVKKITGFDEKEYCFYNCDILTVIPKNDGTNTRIARKIR